MPFPKPEYKQTYFYSVCRSMRRITWEHGFVSVDNRWSCLEQTRDVGIMKNRPEKSVETTKAPCTLISFLFQAKTKEDERDWCIQLHHVEYSTPCQSHQRASHTRLSLSVAQSRRVTSNYSGRSPLSWGLFKPIKFYCKG